MWLDADNSMTGTAVFNLAKEYFDSSIDAIIGSRYVKGGGYKGMLLGRQVCFSNSKCWKNQTIQSAVFYCH